MAKDVFFSNFICIFVFVKRDVLTYPFSPKNGGKSKV